MSDEVLVEIENHMMVLTINRPERKNAANQAVAEIIGQAMERLDSEDDLRLAIITGAGGTFCAGMDIKAYMKGELPIYKERGFAGVAMQPPRKPLIAAIEGNALAGGCELALACDLMVVAENAQLGIAEVKRGMVAAGGGLLYLPRKIPHAIALEMALTGEAISGKRAGELGLANRVVAEGNALSEAKKLAALIAANAPMAVAASKQVMAEYENWSLAEMFDKQGEILYPVFGSEDAVEGAQAFAEKRAPQWKNR